MNIDDFLSFLNKSPTAFHAAQEIGNRLALQDFIPLSQENDSWDIAPGGAYFYEKNGSVMCFKTPVGKPQKATILGSHTDSPCLKLKPVGKTSVKNMVSHGVEVYGSPYLTSWMSRDLCISGIIYYLDTDKELQSSLIHLDDLPLIIPNLAIHLDRNVNESGHKIDRQKHLCPILGLSNEEINSLTFIENILKKQIHFQTLLGFDLFLVPIEKPRLLGYHHELISSYRIDNLSSAYAAMQAMLQSKKQQNTLQMAIFWNHEEIGSGSPEGALSHLAEDLMKQVCMDLSLTEKEYVQLKTKSICVSADAAHAYHPNFTEKYDEGSPPLLGKGIVIKHNANMRYATTAHGSSIIKQLCHTMGLKSQTFVSHSEMPCGSTIGPLFSQVFGIETIDIGIPQLAMHSARELMAVQDEIDLCYLLKGVLENV
ncbi:MAG: M18 family aminopeptidase [Chlamydiales bacterium]|nr:M18 family aminopeptidase [Chlamydiales bacterium]